MDRSLGLFTYSVVYTLVLVAFANERSNSYVQPSTDIGLCGNTIVPVATQYWAFRLSHDMNITPKMPPVSAL